MFDGFWLQLRPPETPKIIEKQIVFFMILVFSLVTVFIALGNQLGSILGAFWVPSWGQNPTKIDSKPIPTTDQKIIAFWIALGTGFGSNLAPSWLQVGPQVGPKSNLAELGPNLAELGPNLAPTWPNLASTWPQLGSPWPQLGSNLPPTWPNLAPT